MLASPPREHHEARTRAQRWIALARACLLVGFASVCLLAVSTSSRAADTRSSDEYALKAAFLLNFVRYTKWPAAIVPDDKSPIIVAVVGPDPFRNVLDDAFKGKTAGSHPLVVRRFGSFLDIDTCHLLYVAPGETPRLETIATKVAGKSVLLVSDAEDGVYRGAAIGFAIQDKRVRFTINSKRLKDENLECSSQLLKLAKIVTGER
jgi:hypothetical protein